MAESELNGRIALVTGGSRGIGAAVCGELGAAGATVVVNYARDASAAQAVAAVIIEAGGDAHVVQGDISTAAGAAELVAGVEETIGPIAILVNNAGITRDNLIMKLEEDDWRAVIDTNLGGAFFTCRAVARPMLKRRAGTIINMSSRGGRARECRSDQLLGVEGGAHRSHQVAGQGAGRSRHPRERHRSRAISQPS